MQVNIRWCAEDGVVDVHYRGMSVDSEAMYQRWTLELHRGFSAALHAAGGKFPLVVDIDELEIRPAFRSRYGMELAPLVAERYASAIARYGRRQDTRSVVAVQALKRVTQAVGSETLRQPEYDANLFDNRADAVAYVLELSRRRAELEGSPQR